MAAQPPAAAPRAARGRLRRQGAPPHHAAQGGRHRRAGGDGADAADRPAVDRSSPRSRRPAVRSRHRILAGFRRRHLPRRDEPAVAPGTAALDGCPRGRAAHGWTRRDRRAPVELARRPRHRLDLDDSYRGRRERADSKGKSAPRATTRSGCARTSPSPGRAPNGWKIASSGPWFPTVEVDKKVDFEGGLPHGAASVRWRARSDGLARHEGAELVVSLSPSQTSASQLAPLVKRTLPVWLPPYVAPRREARTIRLVAPKGWAFEGLPPGGDENGGAFGHAHLEIARDPRDPADDDRQTQRRIRPERHRRGRVSEMARLGAARRRVDAQGSTPHADRGCTVRASLSFCFLCLACGGIPPKAPAAREDLPRAFADAFRVDATGDPDEAVKRHLGVVRAAAQADGDAWQIPALEASLDALATRTMPSLGEEVAIDAALAHRTRGSIVTELAAIAREARGPFARGLVARAINLLDEERGDAAQAEMWRDARGCAREALVIGPTTWAPVTGVAERAPLDDPSARIEASYPTDNVFQTVAHPLVVRGRGCSIALSAESFRPGVREVVVDVDLPRAQTIGVALRAHGAAVLRAGGALALSRSFELGDGEAPRFVRVTATAGILRLVARVGTAKEDDSVELDAWAEDGAPLRMSAPAIGSVAGAHVLESSPPAHVEADALGATSASTREETTLLRAAAAVATGDAREAENGSGRTRRARMRRRPSLWSTDALSRRRAICPSRRARSGREERTTGCSRRGRTAGRRRSHTRCSPGPVEAATRAGSRPSVISMRSDRRTGRRLRCSMRSRAS